MRLKAGGNKGRSLFDAPKNAFGLSALESKDLFW